MPPATVERALSDLERSRDKTLFVHETDASVLREIVWNRRAEVAERIVAHGPIGPEGTKAIAESPHLRRLRHLDLSGARVGDEGVEALASSPALATVEELELGPLTPGRGRRHYGFRSLGALVTNELGDSAFAALARSPYVAALARLDLSASAASDAGVAALAASPHAKRLRSLSLYWTRGATPALAERIGGARFAEQLIDLDLGFCALGDEGARALARHAELRALEKLALEGNAIGEAGASALASSQVLRSLEALDLRRNALGEAGVRRFAGRTGLPKLARLGLDDNGITTGRTQPWYDQGAWVGEGPEPMSPGEIARRYLRRERLSIF
jgi:hypothetical protein